MAEVYQTSGQLSDDGTNYPDLTGIYVPSVDDPQAVDGLGVTLPWGGGPTARKTGEAGGYTVVGSGFAETAPSISGDTITYDIEGIVGPQGPQGPIGPPGSITTIKQQVFVPYGNPDLDEVMQQIRDNWQNEDTILYASDSVIRWNRPWSPLDVKAGISGWNDASLGSDGEFMGIAGDASLYVSTDGGDNWTETDPGTAPYTGIRVAGTSGKAVAVGQSEIWVSTDSGSSWTEKTIDDTGSSETISSHTYGSYSSVDVITTFSLYGFNAGGASAEYAEVTEVVVELYAGLSGGTFDFEGWLNSYPSGTPTAHATASSVVIPGLTATKVTFTFSPAVDAQIYTADHFRFTVSKTAGSGTVYYTSGGTPERPYNEVTGAWITGADINSLDQGSDADTLVAMTDDGVWISDDFGDSWTQYKPDSQDGTVWEIGAAGTGGGYVIAVDSDDNIYRTANSGSSWASIDPTGGETFVPVNIDCSDDGQYWIIVGTNSTDSTHTAYRSADYGVTWAAINPSIVGGNYNWTECQISNTGELVALSRTGAVYLTFDAGDNWEEASIPTSGTTWDCLAVSGDSKVGIISNTADANEFFINSGWYKNPIISESTLADFPDEIGLGTGDNPEFTGLTVSGLSGTRIVATDGASALDSVADLTSWIGGTENQVTITDDGDGSVTASTPQDLDEHTDWKTGSLTVWNTSESIIVYADETEFYVTLETGVPIADGLPIGLLLTLTYDVP